MPGRKKLGLRFARRHFLLKRFPKSRLHRVWNGLRFDTFIDLQRLLSCVDKDETIWTFTHVLFQMALHCRIGTRIQIIIQFL